ncbi:Meiosis protein mei2 [Cyphellophora attinorum]|uniref:Meiosis protein mei2 n=1 Tax=Cyphellophora attinorum TaxID=1664694 RepID=A0A0N1NW64_9EURO|nr:Meiosis protein mei2 [Phialophora attinorum]KPI35994.1 Meiosis protein mei2 [Phialophora attinorum]
MLEITSHGRYDFMYLRIDFANQCNVGYAFINFATPEDIIPFALARQGRRWTIFNSTPFDRSPRAAVQVRTLVKRLEPIIMELDGGPSVVGEKITTTTVAYHLATHYSSHPPPGGDRSDANAAKYASTT